MTPPHLLSNTLWNAMHHASLFIGITIVLPGPQSHTGLLPLMHQTEPPPFQFSFPFIPLTDHSSWYLLHRDIFPFMWHHQHRLFFSSDTRDAGSFFFLFSDTNGLGVSFLFSDTTHAGAFLPSSNNTNMGIFSSHCCWGNFFYISISPKSYCRIKGVLLSNSNVTYVLVQRAYTAILTPPDPYSTTQGRAIWHLPSGHWMSLSCHWLHALPIGTLEAKVFVVQYLGIW